jgi:hypothetical protein
VVATLTSGDGRPVLARGIPGFRGFSGVNGADIEIQFRLQ